MLFCDEDMSNKFTHIYNISATTLSKYTHILLLCSIFVTSNKLILGAVHLNYINWLNPHVYNFFSGYIHIKHQSFDHFRGHIIHKLHHLLSYISCLAFLYGYSIFSTKYSEQLIRSYKYISSKVLTFRSTIF